MNDYNIRSLDYELYNDIRERTHHERLEADEQARKNALWLLLSAGLLVACYLVF